MPPDKEIEKLDMLHLKLMLEEQEKGMVALAQSFVAEINKLQDLMVTTFQNHAKEIQNLQQAIYALQNQIARLNQNPGYVPDPLTNPVPINPNITWEKHTVITTVGTVPVEAAKG